MLVELAPLVVALAVGMRQRLTSLPSRLGMAPTLVRANVLGDSWRDSGMTAADRGYGYRWQQAREAYLRLHPGCVMCEAEGRVESATVVDHKIPHRGDQAKFWNQNNWQSLCATHHSSHKQKQEANAGV